MPSAPADYRDAWERFQNASEAEIPSDERELLDVLAGALGLAKEEWAGTILLNIERLELADDLSTIDFTLKHKGGLTTDGRVFICNKPTQGGGLKRQLDRVLPNMGAKQCFMLRATDFPPNRRTRRRRRSVSSATPAAARSSVPIPEWERMMMVREFHAHHRQDPGFAGWFRQRQAAVQPAASSSCCASTCSDARCQVGGGGSRSGSQRQKSERRPRRGARQRRAIGSRRCDRAANRR